MTRESLERLHEAISDKQLNVSMVEEKVKRLQDQYTEEKEKFNKEGVTFNSEMESLEENIQKTNLENSNSYLLSQQTVQKVKIE